MAHDWQQHGDPHHRIEGGFERTERNPFAAPGPIWANSGLPPAKTGKPARFRFAHTLIVLGLLGLAAGLGLPWAVPPQESNLLDVIRHGQIVAYFRDGLPIFQVVYLNVAALSLAGALLVFCFFLIALNLKMNIPILTGCSGLLGLLALLALTLGFIFLFARQHFVIGASGSEPVALGLYCWFGGLGLLVLGLLAEYVTHLRRSGPGGPAGLGRVL